MLTSNRDKKKNQHCDVENYEKTLAEFISCISSTRKCYPVGVMDFKFSKDEHINKEADGESLFDVVKQKIIKLLNYELLSKPLTKLQKIMIVIYGG